MRISTMLSLFVSLVVIFAASIALADDVADAAQVVPEWPQKPAGFEFGEVAGVGVDSHNHVFIFHRGKDKPIIAFEGASGKYVTSFGEGMFINAHGLEIDDHDNVWVTDTRTHQIYKFSHDGDLLMTLGVKRESGLDSSHFNQPTDIAVAPNGEFFVSDGYGNSRVVKFAADGSYLLDWGKKGDAPGEFNLPHGITLDDKGLVYVCDRTNMRIQVFDGNGKFIRQWAKEQLGEVGRPWGVEFAPDGNLYVIDGADMLTSTPDIARITKLDLEGNVLATWGSYGTAPGQFSWGHDVAVGEDGTVYTAEVRNNNRAQKFEQK